MSINLRLPKITAKSAQEQMSQMESYMYQLVGELNWALNTIESAQKGDTTNVVSSSTGKPLTASDTESAQDTFNSIKALIIKSADIVNSYQDSMTETFDKAYLAQSDFGTFTETNSALIEKNAEDIKQTNTRVETIDKNLDGIADSVRKTEGFIKTGLLGIFGDVPNADGTVTEEELYGILLGEIIAEDGTTKQAYASFTPDKLSFYGDNFEKDNKPVPVAYISKRKLYITSAQFTGNVLMGGYNIETSNGLAFKWVGGVS